MARRYLQLVWLLWLMTAATGAQPPACTMRVGWEEWQPYIHRDNGVFSGPEYEQLQALATLAGCKLTFVELPWLRALQTLQQGDIDLLYGASISADRSEYARFSKPYRYEQMVLVVTNANTPDPVVLGQWLDARRASGELLRLGLIRGFEYGPHLRPLLHPEIRRYLVHEVRWDQQLAGDLLSGRIDGFIVERAVATWMQQQHPELRLLAIHEHQPEPMHLMFGPNVADAVIERFDMAIAQSQTTVAP